MAWPMHGELKELIPCQICKGIEGFFFKESIECLDLNCTCKIETCKCASQLAKLDAWDKHISTMDTVKFCDERQADFERDNKE